jgi:hemoglobin-like flavoprotein
MRWQLWAATHVNLIYPYVNLSVMTTRHIELVQQSWELVKPIAREAGQLFNIHLFTTAPQVRHLFKEDISEQAVKLVRMLNYIVSMLNHLDEIRPQIDHLASAHNRYGAKPEHYAVVGECLIKTLQEGLGENWNPELEEAWVAVYTLLSGEMIQAQQNHAAAVVASMATHGHVSPMQ